MTLYVEECLDYVWRTIKEGGRPNLPTNHALLRAYEVAKRSITEDLEVPLAAIQGPPGTGKTYITERLAEEYLRDHLYSSNDLYIYVAPTNELVMEACRRMLARFIYSRIRGGSDCSEFKSIAETTRVLGYKIKSLGRWEKEGCEVDSSKMVDLAIDRDVRLVFTTEFQRPYFKQLGARLRLIVDESSRSPFFRSFIPLVRRLIAAGYKDYPASMVILGDPQQAISVEEYGRDILLMNVVLKKLAYKELLRSNHVFLDTTYRLPKPSEEPISHGYYSGQLRAFEGADRRLRGIFDSRKVLRRLNYYVDASKREVQMVVEAIEEAFNNKVPVIFFNTRIFTTGDTLDPARAKIASYAYMAIKMWLEEERLGYTTAVTSIYTDMPLAVDYEVGRRGLRLEYRATVQAMIGAERDIIITMLGKEEPIKAPFQILYSREPELLNVQLSRHKRLEVVVGNVEALTHPDHDARIRETANKILELKYRDKILLRDISG